MMEAGGGGGDGGGGVEGRGGGGVDGSQPTLIVCAASASDNTVNHCQPFAPPLRCFHAATLLASLFFFMPRAARLHPRSLRSCVCKRVSVFRSDTQLNGGGW